MKIDVYKDILMSLRKLMPLLGTRTGRGLVHNLLHLVLLTRPKKGRNKPSNNCLVKTFTLKHIPELYFKPRQTSALESFCKKY